MTTLPEQNAKYQTTNHENAEDERQKKSAEEDAKSLLFNLKELAPHVDRY